MRPGKKVYPTRNFVIRFRMKYESIGSSCCRSEKNFPRAIKLKIKLPSLYHEQQTYLVAQGAELKLRMIKKTYQISCDNNV